MSDAGKTEDPDAVVKKLFWKTTIGAIAFCTAVIAYVFGVLF